VALAQTGVAGVQRTFVSSHGNDSNTVQNFSRPFPGTERRLHVHAPAVHNSMAGMRCAGANRIAMVEVSDSQKWP